MNKQILEDWAYVTFPNIYVDTFETLFFFGISLAQLLSSYGFIDEVIVKEVKY